MQLLKLKIPALSKKPTAAEVKQKNDSLTSEFRELAKKLIDEMITAGQEDHLAIEEESGPALARVRLIKQMDLLLMKKPVQSEFLDLGGLEALAFWIKQNPNGSYPLPQVVESVFEVLDRLPISAHSLENSSIAKAVSVYANGATELNYLEHKALSIIQKWQSIVYNLSYRYDKEGFHQKKQRDLRERI
jgi:hypothetical protein